MYTYFLTDVTAQMIADNIMQSIPYNINIMNNDGIIIASGDKARIGDTHRGALKALEMRQPYVVHEDTATERRGINLPIEYGRELVGVIGISGEVNKVMPIGQIVVSTARLMIENQIYNDMSAIKESRLKDFLYEWSQLRRDQYSSKFLEQAQYFGIDVNLPRMAVIITSKRIRYSVMDHLKRFLTEDEYIIRQGMEEMTVLFRSDKKLTQRLEKVLAMSQDLVGCYIGEPSTTARRTCRSARAAYDMARTLGVHRKMVHFKELSLECLLSNLEVNRELEEIMKNLSAGDSDGGLSETIFAYVIHTNSIPEICEQLHIHRNTLNYRLGKIEEITGYNPRCARDLMLLYLAAILLKKK